MRWSAVNSGDTTKAGVTRPTLTRSASDGWTLASACFGVLDVFSADARRGRHPAGSGELESGKPLDP